MTNQESRVQILNRAFVSHVTLFTPTTSAIIPFNQPRNAPGRRSFLLSDWGVRAAAFREATPHSWAGGWVKGRQNPARYHGVNMQNDVENPAFPKEPDLQMVACPVFHIYVNFREGTQRLNVGELSA